MAALNYDARGLVEPDETVLRVSEIRGTVSSGSTSPRAS